MFSKAFPEQWRLPLRVSASSSTESNQVSTTWPRSNMASTDA